MKISRDSKIIFLVEGETEKAVVNALNVLGNPVKFNLWDKDIKKILRRYNPKNSIFIIIFDTDILDNIARFNGNLKILKSSGFVYYLLPQTKNLEEELLYACSLPNNRQLIIHFGAQGLDDCKSIIAQLHPSVLKDKLETLSLDKSRLWSRPIPSSIIHTQNAQYCAGDLISK